MQSQHLRRHQMGMHTCHARTCSRACRYDINTTAHTHLADGPRARAVHVARPVARPMMSDQARWLAGASLMMKGVCSRGLQPEVCSPAVPACAHPHHTWEHGFRGRHRGPCPGPARSGSGRHQGRGGWWRTSAARARGAQPRRSHLARCLTALKPAAHQRCAMASKAQPPALYTCVPPAGRRLARQACTLQLWSADTQNAQRMPAPWSHTCISCGVPPSPLPPLMDHAALLPGPC